MKNWISRMSLAAIISSCVAIPLMALEYVNTNGFATHGIPSALFAVLWLLPFVLVLLAAAAFRNFRSGNGVIRNPAVFVLQAALAIVVVVVWASLVNDQAPCFMGVPNCD